VLRARDMRKDIRPARRGRDSAPLFFRSGEGLDYEAADAGLRGARR
jgi:hypothetical protein